MNDIQLSWDEIVSSLHRLSPQPQTSHLLEATYKFDPEYQCLTKIELVLIEGESKRSLIFEEPWSNGRPGELLVPDPFGFGILVVDVSERGWENSIIVVEDEDELRILFGAKSVSE